MPEFERKAPSAADRSVFEAEAIPKYIDAVRLDKQVPRSDPYEARFAPASLVPSLVALADLTETGAAALNFSPRTTDVPLSLEVRQVTPELDAKIGTWKVEARIQPSALEGVITLLRQLGVEAVGIYSSPTGELAKAEYAWICAGNYEDLKLISAATRTAPVVETLILDLALPPANVSPVTAPAAGKEAVKADSVQA